VSSVAMPRRAREHWDVDGTPVDVERDGLEPRR